MVKALFGAGVAAAIVVVGLSQPAFADGKNAPSVHRPAPAPLNVQPAVKSSSSNGPVIHYANPSAAGTKIYSSNCGSANAEVCSGQFVSTGRVVLAGEAPAYTESVEPVIYNSGTYRGTVAPMASKAIHVKKASKHCDCDHGHHHHGKQQIKLDGNFTGGVGAGVSSNWSGGGGFYSAQYPMVRSRYSVMRHKSSAYSKRNRY